MRFDSINMEIYMYNRILFDSSVIKISYIRDRGPGFHTLREILAIATLINRFRTVRVGE